MAITAITITGTYEVAGEPAVGTVSFRYNSFLLDTSTNTIYPNTPTTVELDENGQLSVEMLATDDETTTPEGVMLQVVERIVGRAVRSYYMSVPADSPGNTIDLADVAPATPETLNQYASVGTLNEHINNHPSGNPVDVRDVDGTPEVTAVTAIEFPNGSVSSPSTGVARIAFVADAHDHDADYEPLGTAATEVTAHEAEANPHPTYLTQAEGTALYSLLGHTHTTAEIVALTEFAQDLVGAMMLAGANMGSVTYDDTAGTVTITGVAGLTTEQVQDIVGAMTVAGANVTVTYDDTAGTLTIAATGGGGGVTDHGALTGLADDDHPQYVTHAEGDAAYDALGAADDVATDLTTHEALTTTAHGGIVASTDPRLTDARTPTAHNHAGEEITSGTVAGARLPSASTSAAGIVELATSAETMAGLAVQASDTRLSDARTPTSHNHPTSEVTAFGEDVYDNVAAILTAGTNITLTPNDTNNTVTIDASGGGGGTDILAVQVFS